MAASGIKSAHMTKEAEMLALANEVHAVYLNTSDMRLADMLDRVETALRAAAVPAPDAGLVERETISFDYTNYRGEQSVRQAVPISVRFGTSEYHKDYQWLMLAFDLEKKAEREFAMADMRTVTPRTALLSPRAVAGEPVAWQQRRKSLISGEYGSWYPATKGDARHYAGHDEIEVRPLYTRSTTTPSGRDPTDAEVEAAWKECTFPLHHDDVKRTIREAFKAGYLLHRGRSGYGPIVEAVARFFDNQNGDHDFPDVPISEESLRKAHVVIAIVRGAAGRDLTKSKD